MRVGAPGSGRASVRQEWQVEMQRRALPRRALQPHAAPLRLHELRDARETQTRAPARCLAREEGKILEKLKANTLEIERTQASLNRIKDSLAGFIAQTAKAQLMPSIMLW